ncbi:MAG TPA: folate family ECF transporter S component [Firmicutes bacterium]|nr:folate family ECF transporter S component [Bacillota bacterium]
MSFFLWKRENLHTYLETFKKPQRIILCGLFAALYLVLYQLNIPISLVSQIRFGFLALAAAGFCGGPLMGAIVGILGDLLCMLITGGSGGLFFGFTVSYALIGFLFGMIFYQQEITVLRTIAGGVAEFLVSVFLNTWWLQIMYGSTYTAQLITRLPKCLFTLVVDSLLLFLFLKALSMAILRSKVRI